MSIQPNINDPNDPTYFDPTLSDGTSTSDVSTTGKVVPLPNLASSSAQDTLASTPNTGPTQQVVSASFPTLAPISLLAFSQLQSQAEATSQDQQYLQDQANAQVMTAFYQAGIESGLNLINSAGTILTVNGAFGGIYAEQQAAILALEAAYAQYAQATESTTPPLSQAVAEFNQATVNLQQAQANLASAQASYGQAQSDYDVAYANEQNDPSPANAAALAAATVNLDNATTNLTNAQSAVSDAQVAYNSASATYSSVQASLEGAIIELNTSILGYNDTMNGINLQIAEYDENLELEYPFQPDLVADLSIEGIPNPDLSPYNLPGIPGYPSQITIGPLPFPSMDNGNLIPTDESAIQFVLSNQLLPSLANALLILGNATDIYQSIDEYYAFVNFYFEFNPNNLVIFPDSFTTPSVQAFIEAYGQGSGVALATMVSDLNNPLLSTILDRSVYASLAFQLQETPSERLIDSFQFLNLVELNNIGLAAGLFAVNQFNQLGPLAQAALYDLNSPAVNFLLGLGYINQVAFAINSGTTRDAVIQLLANEYPNLTPDQLEVEADQVVAASNYFNTLQGLSLFGQAIGDPFFVGQFLGTLGFQEAVALAQETTYGDVLGNELALAYLQGNLIDQINANGFLVGLDIQEVVNQAIYNAVNNYEYTTPAELQQAFANAFEQSGVNPYEANLLAVQAAAYVQAEVVAPFVLDTTVNYQLLNQQYLVDTLVAQNVNADIAAAGVAALFGQDFFVAQQEIAFRDVRDALAEQLILQGVPAGDALIAATEAVTGNLNVGFTFNVLPLEEFQAQLENRIVFQLSPIIGGEAAQAYADQVAATFWGGDLLQAEQVAYAQLVQQQIAILQQQDNQRLLAAVTNKARDFIVPSPEGFAVNQMLMGHGKSLLQTTGKHGEQMTLPTEFNV